MRLCYGMSVYKNDADDEGWDTIPFIVDGTMLLSTYLFSFLSDKNCYLLAIFFFPIDYQSSFFIFKWLKAV